MPSDNIDVQLKPILDKSSFNKELNELQKLADKNGLKITPKLNTSAALKDIKALSTAYSKALSSASVTNSGAKSDTTNSTLKETLGLIDKTIDAYKKFNSIKEMSASVAKSLDRLTLMEESDYKIAWIF